MSEIRRLTDQEVERFAVIVANAYPGFKATTEEEIAGLGQRLIRTRQEEETTDLYGLFRIGELLGGKRLHDFRM